MRSVAICLPRATPHASSAVAAADGRLLEAELQMLKEIRYELNIDRLHAAAIERGARARHQKLS